MNLFMPGPIWVHPDVLEAMAKQPLGHRSKEYSEVHARVVTKMKQILNAKDHVFLSTSSGSGVWEIAARNCVRERALACMCGAFSDKWADVVRRNGKDVAELKVEWGKPITAQMVDDALKRHTVDSVLLVHNETSTGLANPFAEIAEVVKRHSDVLLLVDAVSSMGGMAIDVDGWGADIVLASGQKALGIPPGLAVFSASARAVERAKTLENRGYYFDLLEYAKRGEKSQTPTTPAEPQIYALDAVTDRILAEGVEARFARHRRMADLARAWARERFALFPEEGYESDTLTCIANTRGIDVAALNKALLAERGCIIGNGYGDLKDKTFRIAHMGDMREEQIRELLGWIDEALA